LLPVPRAQDARHDHEHVRIERAHVVERRVDVRPRRDAQRRPLRDPAPQVEHARAVGERIDHDVALRRRWHLRERPHAADAMKRPLRAQHQLRLAGRPRGRLDDVERTDLRLPRAQHDKRVVDRRQRLRDERTQLEHRHAGVAEVRAMLVAREHGDGLGALDQPAHRRVRRARIERHRDDAAMRARDREVHRIVNVVEEAHDTLPRSDAARVERSDDARDPPRELAVRHHAGRRTTPVAQADPIGHGLGRLDEQRAKASCRLWHHGVRTAHVIRAYHRM
jgi:hypothetical protein